MIEINLEQFKQNPDEYIRSVLADGSIIAVDTGRGKMVMMEEDEYNILREALVVLIGLNDKPPPLN
jgi:PHD/YefM family antitoxin component YafN of YafNO toxin-antitoxin module